jgi:hypothetical protein
VPALVAFFGDRDDAQRRHNRLKYDQGHRGNNDKIDVAHVELFTISRHCLSPTCECLGEDTEVRTVLAGLLLLLSIPAAEARTPRFVHYGWGSYHVSHHRHHARTRRPATVAVSTKAPLGLSMVFTQTEVDAMARCEAAIPADVIDEAKHYLVDTATPGGTMSHQGVKWTIEQLHPVFAVRLARAIWVNRQKGGHASVFSAYRKPGLGVGGFADKFNSFHSYGLAVDMTGIGSPGSAAHQAWCLTAHANGLVDPYRAAVEFNHFQLVPKTIVAQSSPMRRLVSAARGPIDKVKMWLASGFSPDGIEPPIIRMLFH